MKYIIIFLTMINFVEAQEAQPYIVDYLPSEMNYVRGKVLEESLSGNPSDTLSCDVYYVVKDRMEDIDKDLNKLSKKITKVHKKIARSLNPKRNERTIKLENQLIEFENERRSLEFEKSSLTSHNILNPDRKIHITWDLKTVLPMDKTFIKFVSKSIGVYSQFTNQEDSKKAMKGMSFESNLAKISLDMSPMEFCAARDKVNSFRMVGDLSAKSNDFDYLYKDVIFILGFEL